MFTDAPKMLQVVVGLGVRKCAMNHALTCHFRRASTLAVLLLTWYLGQTCARAGISPTALPTGGTVVQGTAPPFTTSGSQSSPQLTINQTSVNACINWSSFNIGQNATVNFNQPSASSVTWNNINDTTYSSIYGKINANGYVVLQNPNGFYVGGTAAITAHGLIMTTATTPAPNLFSGGAWSFNAPPPTASIINYGQINITGGGSVFLIAADIENRNGIDDQNNNGIGTISAPGGRIGLYAGRQILVSTSPDGRGLSAEVTLPAGSVDNQGNLIADAGSIAAQAQFVNQGGLIQANSVQNNNGVIELVASDNLNLGASSDISAHGDAQGASSGGSVTIKSDNSFSDQTGSTINISGGAQGGNGGQVEISAPQMGVINSSINGQAADGFVGGKLTIDPYNITLDSAYVSSLNALIAGGLSQIDLQADNNIELSTLWTLADPGAAATLSLTAGNNITLNNSINAKNNWSINLTAGTQLPPGTLPAAGNDGIYLNGASYIQTQNGNISLFAPNEVIVGGGAIRTLNGGSISVATEYGDVNSGNNANGYTFGQSAAPYYVVDAAHLGGISTAAGGNVTITAGGDVISYLPTQSVYINLAADKFTFDGGTGAFGSQHGNVTITAGGNVYGHYVLANGIGTITAGGNIGAPVSVLTGDSTKSFALSLVKGGWDVYAPNGSIYVQDVRNPNGIFGENGSHAADYAGFHYFDYDPLSSILFDAGDSVEIIGSGADAPNNPTISAIGPIPMILPPTLQVITGSGDFVLDTSVILFPSPNQNLNLNIGGNFVASGSEPVDLEMSDSAGSRWTREHDFGTLDHAALPPELNNPNPVEISVSGNVENVNLYTTKETHMTVGGNMINSGFVGENLHAGDATSINVTGYIYNSPLYSFAPLSSTIDSANPLQPGLWDSIFDLAVDPSALVLDPKTGVIPLYNFDANHPPDSNGLQYYLHSKGYLLFPGTDNNSYGFNPGFIYDPASLQLGFNGPMSLSSRQLALLEGGTITVLQADAHGTPLKDSNGHLMVTTYTFNWGSAIASLYSESQNAISTADLGFLIGGPGQFNIHAASIDFGNSPGIISDGFGSGYSSLQGVTGTLGSGGAAINVNVDGDLNLITSAIYSIDGGNVSVYAGGKINLCQGNFDFRTVDCYGIYTSGHSDVSVTANGDINIGSGCIATFNGGNAFVESFNGNVNAGNGANKALNIYGIYFSQDTGLPIYNIFGNYTDETSLMLNPTPYGSGILAEYPTLAYQTPGGSGQPGDITVLTPNGNIVSSRGGISQFALNGSIAGGPTINLIAGKSDVDATPDQGNIFLGQGGAIGGTVNVTPGKGGNVEGLIIARQNVNINTSGNFNGTVLAGGTANFAGGGSVAGTVVGIGGINVSGGGAVTATLLSQNVSVGGGGAESTLGTSSSATSASQSAAQQASSDAKQQTIGNDNDDDQKKKKKASAIQRIKRVTVILANLLEGVR
jgi:filamentous hemagglutinin family protein